MRLLNFLRIFIYCWVSLAILNVFVGIVTIEVKGGIGNSDFPPLYISLPLLAALILNILLVQKIRTANNQDDKTRNKLLLQVLTIVLLEIILGAYTFYLQTFGEELIILIAILIVLASSNLIYFKLNRKS